MNVLQLETDSLRAVFSYGLGLTLTELTDRASGHNYVMSPTPFFACGDSTVRTAADGSVDKYAQLTPSNVGLTVTLRNPNRAPADQAVLDAVPNGDGTTPPHFTYTLTLRAEGNRLFATLSASNRTSEHRLCKLALPALTNLRAEGDPAETCISVPQELGNLDLFAGDGRLGLGINLESGLPTGHASLSVLTLYDPVSGNGLYLADTEGGLEKGRIPLTFADRSHTLCGYYALELDGGATEAAPTVAIGISRGREWYEAADYWRSLQPSVTWPAPDWLRYAGALYADRPEGAGGCYLGLPWKPISLPEKLQGDFRNLPEFLAEARTFGTSLLYLVDWWEKADISGLDEETIRQRPYVLDPYWNKGDYYPRKDLGGADAFREGIRAVHEQGGHVIVYVEAFIIFLLSDIARAHGLDWCAYKADGTPADDYPYNYTLLYDHPEWQEYIAEKCAAIVRDYGVDGIFYDSTGWQWHRRFYDKNGKLHTSEQSSLGLLALLDKTRAAIRAVKPDAVILGESGSGPMLWKLDGGLTNDLGWANQGSVKSLVSAPARYAFKEGNLFAGGVNFSELYQCFAAGVNLALCDRWNDLPGGLPGKAPADEIRELVELRLRLRDALVDGDLIREPQTGSIHVPAYLFRGSTHTVLNLCNTAAEPYDASPCPGPGYAGSRWHDARTGTVFTADETGRITVPMSPRSLAVLVLEGSSADGATVSRRA